MQFVERRFISGQQWTPDLFSGTSKETLTIVLVPSVLQTKCRLQCCSGGDAKSQLPRAME